MALVSVNPVDLAHFLRDRRQSGGDRHDEVWDGVYVMSPLADNEHQQLSLELAMAIRLALGDDPAVQVFPGCNVSSRSQRWRRNYRCPDVAVFLPGNPAEDRGSHWYGGPDLVVEVESPFDRCREKFGFYARVLVHELLLVTRRPWSLELHQRSGQEWRLAGKSEVAEPSVRLQSALFPLDFRLVPGARRPRIEVRHTRKDLHWLA